MPEMTEASIREFWDAHPCGERQVAGVQGDLETLFECYDRCRYNLEGHIRRRLNAIEFEGKRVLEVGLGQGADSEQIIRRGAIWSGPDSLTPLLIGLPHACAHKDSIMTVSNVEALSRFRSQTGQFRHRVRPRRLTPHFRYRHRAASAPRSARLLAC
jgi:hypothetical protein